MDKKGQKIKEKISKRALKLFQDKGYQVSISEICNAAGITRSSFYNQFSSKDDIIIYFLDNANALSEETFDKFAFADNDFERLWLMVDNRLSIIEQFGPQVTKALFKLELDKQIPILGLPDTLYSRICKLYRNCIAQGLAVCQENPDERIRYAENMTIGIIFEWGRSAGTFNLREYARKANEAILGIKQVECSN